MSFAQRKGGGRTGTRACEVCIDSWPLPPAANLGFVYASDPLAERSI